MTRKLLMSVMTLATTFLLASTARAWNEINISFMYPQTIEALRRYSEEQTYWTGWYSESGCYKDEEENENPPCSPACIAYWTWNFSGGDVQPPPDPPPPPPPCDTGDQRYVRYNSTGHYNITVKGTDNQGAWGEDTCIFTVFKMLLGMSGVSETSEENPGGFLAFNDDDDNENGVPDYDDPGDASEDDLVAITIGCSPANLGGYLELRAHTPIKVWSDPHKGAGNLLIPNGENLYRRWVVGSFPATMWVEGVNSAGFLSGESALRLWYTTSSVSPSYPGAQYNPDLVNLTLVWVDMDMAGVDADEEESVGGYIALGAEKQLTLWRVQPAGVPPVGVPLDSSHPMTLDVKYADRGSGLIEIWDYSEWPPGKLSLPKTYSTTEFLLDDLHIKGTSASSMLRGITLIWEYTIGGRTVQDRIKCTVYAVEDVQWETYPDVVGANPDHGANLPIDGNPGGGKRIYPDKKVYEDTDDEADMRRKVIVEATIRPVIEDMTVYFKWWDVDDPSTSSTIDENGPDGGDNNGACGGLGLLGGLLKDERQTNSSGEARITFDVSMCPGDNFKIAASCVEAKIDEMTQEQADGIEPLPNSVVTSPMLTVWRKLHIEQDSMDQVADSGDEKNFISGTAESYIFPSPGVGGLTRVLLGQALLGDFSYVNQFQNGWYVPYGASAASVISNTSFLGAENDRAEVNGNISGSSLTYDLYDDDYTSALVPHISLPTYPVMGAYDSEFERAYIMIKYLDGTYSDVVPFDRNLPLSSVNWGIGSWNNYKDCSGSQPFWSVLLVTGYQGDSNKDMDGAGDATELDGATNDDEEIVIYLETIRELGGTLISQVMAHEIGHTDGLVEGSRAINDGHCANPGCIMEAGSSGTQFCDQCIKDMRSKSKWDWE